MAQQEAFGRERSAPFVFEKARELAFIGIAAFVLVAPALPQVFGFNAVWLSSWVTYSGVGVGILKGEFQLFSPGEEARQLPPLEVLGVTQYPVLRHYEFDRRVGTAAELRRFAQSYCDDLQPEQKLSYRGFTGSRQGWQVLESEDVCGIDDDAIELERHDPGGSGHRRGWRRDRG